MKHIIDSDLSLVGVVTTPDMRHRAALYVCSRFDKEEATVVLDMLGLIGEGDTP